MNEKKKTKNKKQTNTTTMKRHMKNVIKNKKIIHQPK
jgi:hypothetical protein